MIAIEDSHSNRTVIERAGNVAIAIVAPDGQRTALTIDANGYLSSLSNAAAETTSFSYADDGLLLTMTDAKGATSTMTYDAKGRLIRDVNAAGGSWDIVRTLSNNSYEVSMTSAEGRSTLYQVESLATGDQNRITVAPDGSQTQTLRKTSDTTVTTDADGTVTTQKNQADPRFGMQVPIAASTITATPSGLVSETKITRDVGFAELNNPLSMLYITDKISTNGLTSTNRFDAQKKTFTHETQNGRRTITSINNQGQPLTLRFANLEPMNLGYDARGRLFNLTQGTGLWARTSSMTYNSSGFVDSVTDALSRTTRVDYDLVGRVTRETFPDTRTIQYRYDANGNVSAIIPPGREAHVFDYTAVNLESSYTPPLLDSALNVTRYSYNLDKQLDLITRPDGQTLDLTYDAGGRLDTLISPAGVVDYSYHPTTGQLATITANDGSNLSYTYDGFLPITEIYTGVFTGSIKRVFDNNFWLRDLQLNGEGIAYNYDLDGLLTSVGTLTIRRDLSHGLLSDTRQGNVTTIQGYSRFGELSDFRADYASAPLLQLHYNRDALGRIQEKIETIDGVITLHRYTYDLAGHLIEVAKNGTPVAQYDYDQNGNRIGGHTTQGVISANYDAQDRLVTSNGATYLYTLNGELTAKIENGQTTQYTYDLLGNLTHVTLADGTTIDYVIDARSRRVGKKVNGVLVQGFLYQDQLEPIAEVDSTGVVVTRFVYGSNANSPDYLIKGNTTYRIISDHLGSPRMMVDIATGAIAQRIDYDEFGNIASDTNPGFQPFGFAGGLYDQQTKLTRFGARDYDSQTGRWTAKDPIKFAGGDTNLYGYVLSDPVNSVDPLGLAPDQIGLLQIILPAHTAQVSRNPIGGSVQSQIEYAVTVSAMRDAVGDAAYAASPAGPIYVALPIKQGFKKIAEKITESPLDRLIKEAGNSKACQR